MGILASEAFWITAWVVAALLALWLPAWIRARRSADWSPSQRMLWEALHRLSDGRLTDGRAEGRWGDVPVRIAVGTDRVVVEEHAGSVRREYGVRACVRLALPDQQDTFRARSFAPTDPEEPDWEVPGESIDALGPRFRGDGPMPRALRSRLSEEARRWLMELPRSDGQAGWYRVELATRSGELVFGGIAVDVGWGKVLHALRSIAVQLPEAVGDYRSAPRTLAPWSDPPPMPAPPPHRGSARLWRSVRIIGFLFGPFVVFVLPLCVWMGWFTHALAQEGAAEAFYVVASVGASGLAAIAAGIWRMRIDPKPPPTLPEPSTTTAP